MKKPTNHSGMLFGRLTAIEIVGKRGRNVIWRCSCACGSSTEVSAQSLVSGNTSSCGCLRREIASATKTTHGMTNTKTFRAWWEMRRRCEDKQNPDYGGRGIGYCERWNEFSAFYADMGEGSLGMTLERNDVNGDYCPENCRWATQKEQARNQRRTIRVSINGELQSLRDYCERNGASFKKLRDRIKKYGWDERRALETP